MKILSVTSMRNEAPYLLEWLAHHLGAGVSDFLVFSNDCDDGTDAMLSGLQDAGILTHVPHQPKPGKSIQWQAFQAAWRHQMRKQSDWVLVSDVDEFLNIHAGGHHLRDLLKALPGNVDGVVIPWRLFGHNDQLHFEDRPVTEQFTKSLPADCQYPVAATFGKTLFRSTGPFNQLGVHRPKQKSPDKAGWPILVDGAGQPLPPEFIENPQRLSLLGLSNGRSLVEINHYAIRSAAGFLIKRARGLPNRVGKEVDLAYWVERNFNTETNRSIAPMRPATEAQYDRLIDLPGIAAHHAKAVQWHRAAFDRLIAQPNEQRLMTQILTAGGSDALPVKIQRQLIDWYQAANPG